MSLGSRNDTLALIENGTVGAQISGIGALEDESGNAAVGIAAGVAAVVGIGLLAFSIFGWRWRKEKKGRWAAVMGRVVLAILRRLCCRRCRPPDDVKAQPSKIEVDEAAPAPAADSPTRSGRDGEGDGRDAEAEAEADDEGAKPVRTSEGFQEEEDGVAMLDSELDEQPNSFPMPTGDGSDDGSEPDTPLQPDFRPGGEDLVSQWASRGGGRVRVVIDELEDAELLASALDGGGFRVQDEREQAGAARRSPGNDATLGSAPTRAAPWLLDRNVELETTPGFQSLVPRLQLDSASGEASRLSTRLAEDRVSWGGPQLSSSDCAGLDEAMGGFAQIRSPDELPSRDALSLRRGGKPLGGELDPLHGCGLTSPRLALRESVERGLECRELTPNTNLMLPSLERTLTPAAASVRGEPLTPRCSSRARVGVGNSEPSAPPTPASASSANPGEAGGSEEAPAGTAGAAALRRARQAKLEKRRERRAAERAAPPLGAVPSVTADPAPIDPMGGDEPISPTRTKEEKQASRRQRRTLPAAAAGIRDRSAVPVRTTPARAEGSSPILRDRSRVTVRGGETGAQPEVWSSEDADSKPNSQSLSLGGGAIAAALRLAAEEAERAGSGGDDGVAGAVGDSPRLCPVAHSNKPSTGLAARFLSSSPRGPRGARPSTAAAHPRLDARRSSGLAYSGTRAGDATSPQRPSTSGGAPSRANSLDWAVEEESNAESNAESNTESNAESNAAAADTSSSTSASDSVGRIGKRSSMPAAATSHFASPSDPVGRIGKRSRQSLPVNLLARAAAPAAEEADEAALPANLLADDRLNRAAPPATEADEAALPANLLVDDRLNRAAPPAAETPVPSLEDTWREAMRRERESRGFGSAASSSSAAPVGRSDEERFSEGMRKEREARRDSAEWQRDRALRSFTPEGSSCAQPTASVSSAMLTPPPFALPSAPFSQTFTPPTPPQPPQSWLSASSRHSERTSAADRPTPYVQNAAFASASPPPDAPSSLWTPPPPMERESSHSSDISSRADSLERKRRGGKAGNLSGKAISKRRANASGGANNGAASSKPVITI